MQMNKTLPGQLFTFPFSTGKYYLLLFLIWPFMAFITAIANYSRKEAKMVVYLFLIYYGLTFIVTRGVDAERYAFWLKENAALPFSEFFNILKGLYATGTSVDIVEPLISFIISRFTSHHSLLFAGYAALFGFFYLKSINLLHENYKKNPGHNALIIMAFFVLIMPITNISGFRMWTASWVFFYGAYHVVLHRDVRYLIIALAASLVHFSFLTVNVILIIYFFVGNRNVIYFPLAIASFIVPNLITPFFQSTSLRLGGGLQTRFDAYSSEDYVLAVQRRQEEAVWFIQLGNSLVFYYLLLAIVLIQLRSENFRKEQPEINLYSFLLLFLAFVNFSVVSPTLAGRLQLVFFLFATLYVFLYFLKMPGNRINSLVLIGLFPMLLYAAITIRIGSGSINAWILSPVIGSPFLTSGLSLADLLFN